MKTKKMMAIVAAAVMAMGAMAGCGSSSAADPDKGKVYFVNNKKEIVDQLEDLADQYTKETGVQVKVLTAADGYDNTLASELAKTEAPTMWSITGYPNFIKWKDYMEPVGLRRLQAADRRGQGQLVSSRRQPLHVAVRRGMVRHHL